MKRYTHTQTVEACKYCPNCVLESGVYMCESLDIALNAAETLPKGFDMDTMIHPECILDDTKDEE